MMERAVIVNADDFGQSVGVNRGIAQAHQFGVLTSASLMVRGQAVRQAYEYWERHPELGVGIHLDFGEWILRRGQWIALYEVVDLTDYHAVRGEIMSQLEAFSRLTRRIPSHIDSHQHKHREEPLRSIVQEVSSQMGVPVRGEVVPYCGSFYGQDQNGVSRPEWISVAALTKIFEGLTAPVTELSCHPSAEEDFHTMYSAERLIELATLCDVITREAVARFGIELVSYAGLGR